MRNVCEWVNEWVPLIIRGYRVPAVTTILWVMWRHYNGVPPREYYFISWYYTLLSIIQGDQKVYVHLIITIQIIPLSQHTSFFPHFLAQFDCLAADRQDQGDTRFTLTQSVIHNANYVITVSDWNCLKYFCVFLYCNYRVHRNVLNTLYNVCTVY
jgi:hypothetical protein